MVGDNSDVRPPADDEKWTGGIMQWGGAAGNNFSIDETISLKLDGVFFADGTFAGPNRYGMWDEVTSAAAAYSELSRVARISREGGAMATQTIALLQSLAPASDRSPGRSKPGEPRDADYFRAHAFQQLGWRISEARKRTGDEATVQMVVDWGKARLPEFRRLPPP